MGGDQTGPGVGPGNGREGDGAGGAAQGGGGDDPGLGGGVHVARRGDIVALLDVASVDYLKIFMLANG